MSPWNKYSWEATHLTVIAGVITTLSVVIHLTGTSPVESPPPGKAAAVRPDSNALSPSAGAQPTFPKASSSRHIAAHSTRADSHQISVGPSGISNRYTLVGIQRKPISPTLDELTLKLQVKSLASENLVSPFESGMLELKSEGLEPINPRDPFRTPLPSGSSRDQEIAFSVPTSLNLKRTSLQIHYYNYHNEIPLTLSVKASE